MEPPAAMASPVMSVTLVFLFAGAMAIQEGQLHATDLVMIGLVLLLPPLLAIVGAAILGRRCEVSESTEQVCLDKQDPRRWPLQAGFKCSWMGAFHPSGRYRYIGGSRHEQGEDP